MAVGIFKNPVGGLSPLGFIPVAVAGTTVGLNTFTGKQGESATSGRATNRFRQIIIASDPANTKNVYLVWNGYTGPLGANYDARYVLDKIPPGQQRSYPVGALSDGARLNIDNFVLDSDVNGEGAYCSVFYG